MSPCLNEILRLGDKLVFSKYVDDTHDVIFIQRVWGGSPATKNGGSKIAIRLNNFKKGRELSKISRTAGCRKLHVRL